MHIIKTTADLQHLLTVKRKNQPNVTVGFVPTMGALHQGHISLINSASSDNLITVCSIFVNPTQFGDKSDLEKYPRPIENDIKILEKNGCSVLFLPEFNEVYPDSYTEREYDLNNLDHKIEGASRPGHYQGVCNVVHRFFEIVQPDYAYFGQKDFQQTVVIKHMVRSLNLGVQIKIVPIKREKHGLAMSSRNVRLSSKGRTNAAFINRALLNLKTDLVEMDLAHAMAKAKQFIESQKGAQIDYLLAVNGDTLEPVNQLEAHKSVVVLTVVEYENVRLLDNIILK